MRKFLPLLPVLLIILTACPHKKDVINGDDLVISNFVYDGLSAYYLWADEVESKKPTSSNKDAEKYFYGILNSIDKQHGWSWITDDVNSLLNEFAGTPVDYGWSLALYKVTGTSKNVIAVVKYVFPGTPAFEAGVQRGNIIDKIGGTTLDTINYESLLFSTSTITANVSDKNFQNPRTVNLTPRSIQTNPVLLDTVFQGRPEYGGKKIGYMFYTDFISDFNNKLYDAFSRFKTAGVTDLVIDLRYNHGGGIDAAAYFASLVAPKTVVQNQSVFTMLQFNDFLNGVFDKEDANGRKTFFVNSGAQNPLNMNLDFNKVYIIATDDTYSAAELLTFCLKPYMNVIHIGEGTGGKYTGSWTIHAYSTFKDADGNNRTTPVYDENDLSNEKKAALQNWAMQAIVAKYTDKDGKDFISPGYLAPNYPVESIENKPSAWQPIGSTSDYLLAKALSIITGNSTFATTAAGTQPRSVYNLSGRRIYSGKESRLKESVQLMPPSKKDFSSQLLLKIKERQNLQ